MVVEYKKECYAKQRGNMDRKVKFFSALILMASLLGCATTAKYEKVLNSWIGSEEVELIREWGPPQQSYESGGVKFLAYTSGRNVYMPGMAPSYTTTYIGNTAYTTPVGGSPGYNMSMQCVTTFEVAQGRIVRWRWQGNDCKSK